MSSAANGLGEQPAEARPGLATRERRAAPPPRLRTNSAVPTVNSLVHQLIARVAIPELHRRHCGGASLLPARREADSLRMRGAIRAAATQLVREPAALVLAYLRAELPERLAAPEMLVSEILPRLGAEIDSAVEQGHMGSAHADIAFTKLRLMARAIWQPESELAPQRPVARVALMTMLDDRPGFEFVPVERALARRGHDVACLEGMSARNFMTTVQSRRFDAIVVSVRRDGLRHTLSQWVRAGRLVARGRPDFVELAHDGHGVSPLHGCTGAVASPDACVDAIETLMMDRDRGSSAKATTSVACPANTLSTYRSGAGQDVARRFRVGGAGAARHA